MIKTNKKHWVNGHQVRANWFNTFTLSFFNIGIMFIWGTEPIDSRYSFNGKRIVSRLEFYKLI